MALKGFLAIAKGLLIIYSTTHNHLALLIQVLVAWHADADFGILSERLALFRASLLCLSARKDTTRNMGLQKNFKFSAGGMEVLGRWFLLNAW
jgi:hypothetical protein